MVTLETVEKVVMALDSDATLRVTRHADRNNTTGAIGTVTLYRADSIRERRAMVAWPLFDGDTLGDAALKSFVTFLV